jgi:hypothetical protein
MGFLFPLFLIYELIFGRKFLSLNVTAIGKNIGPIEREGG